MPAITATRVDDGYRLSASGVSLGTLFRAEAGWVIVTCWKTSGRRVWRRSRPYPTAADAARARWGAAAAHAVAA